ncbi:MAG: molybdopterin molybdotransferase MoeA [Bacteroidota bacterium]|nr:molybdopterin molybdotransferase MoeA [Bacteroidota bacterium]MDP4232256.1 molybdopterin molybdotransferase MoeA [Bacteroidota bacterium]MDP4242658.1 molybdopterin molybdotransferase MoeA [Bacteroidota bacterium]MDP4286780.1 molybdopterin molybdotransferase MoeA [Bacteroidota bacterium]
MIPLEEAQRLLAECVKPGRIIDLPLLESLGLALAKSVTAKSDSPRFDVSAVDGYAVSLDDFAGGLPTLPVSGILEAGTTSREALKHGRTLRIFTGAPVPRGAHAIVMQEDVTIQGDKAVFHKHPAPGLHIRPRGGELHRGEKLFESDTIITPAVAQTLAASGYARVKVYARPIVSIITTGNELRTPGSSLQHGEIWDSNSIALQGALQALGITSIRMHHVADHLASTTRAIRTALERSDIVIVSGGVSVGERDYVREACTSNGVREIFWRVSMKPGKPIYFGTARRAGKTKYIFGLPGNPVSVMVTYQLFVRPAILQMMGHHNTHRSVRGILATRLTKSDSRLEFVRACREYTTGEFPRIVLLESRESHMTTSMAKADCLVVFPAARDRLDAGSEVDVIPIQWGTY